MMMIVVMMVMIRDKGDNDDNFQKDSACSTLLHKLYPFDNEDDDGDNNGDDDDDNDSDDGDDGDDCGDDGDDKGQG